VTEVKSAKLLRQARQRCLSPTFWLVVRHENRQMKVLTVDYSGERVLPVFSGQGEAGMFVWLGGAFEDEWRVRVCRCGEGDTRSLAGDDGGDDPPGQCKPGEVRTLDPR
jgi:hypothetical protein